MRLNLAGDIAPKLDYRVQIEFASPKIVDAYVRYRPFEQLNFQLGEYKVPFSIENTDYVPLKYEFIEYPMALRRLMGFDDVCGLSATGRDLGAMVYGGFFNKKGYSILSYDLAVFNGEGLNTKDKNKSKDIVARMTLRPARGLQVSGPITGANMAPITSNASATVSEPATTRVPWSCAASMSAERRGFPRAANWTAGAGTPSAAGA